MAQEIMELSVDTGSVVVEVKNERDEKIGEIEILPTDFEILNRYEKVVEFFNSLEVSENPDEKELNALSESIKEQFDYLFNYSVSECVFSKCGPLTIVSNGDFFFEDVLVKICGLIEKITDRRVKKKMAKVKKATAKYHK